jgi:hypothetical protein
VTLALRALLLLSVLLAPARAFADVATSSTAIAIPPFVGPARAGVDHFHAAIVVAFSRAGWPVLASEHADQAELRVDGVLEKRAAGYFFEARLVARDGSVLETATWTYRRARNVEKGFRMNAERAAAKIVEKFAPHLVHRSTAIEPEPAPPSEPEPEPLPVVQLEVPAEVPAFAALPDEPSLSVGGTIFYSGVAIAAAGIAVGLFAHYGYNAPLNDGSLRSGVENQRLLETGERLAFAADLTLIVGAAAAGAGALIWAFESDDASGGP